MKKDAVFQTEKAISFFSLALIIAALFVLAGMIYILNATVQRAERLDRLEIQRSHAELAVQELVAASDYLTSEVRWYESTGQREHLVNFWHEVEETRSRDKAIEKLLHANLTEQEKTHVLRAKSYSDSLLASEAWSMRMLAEANGEEIDQLPRRIQKVELNPAEKALPAKAKKLQVHNYLYGQEYVRSKNLIQAMVSAFNVDLSKRLEYSVSAMLRANREANRYAVWSIASLMILMIALIFGYTRLVRQKNNQLEKALQEAEAASSAKSYFTSRMSHEIRTPLNAVLGYLHLAEQTETPARKSEHLAKCRIAAKNLLGIVNDVLDLSAIENGRMQLAQEPYSVHRLLQELQVVYASIAASKGVTLKVTTEGITRDWLLGDPMRLNQILNNLLSNALKFTPSGGTIEVKASQQDLGPSVRMTYVVSDTGIGMSKEFLPHIYDAYEQENASIHQRFGGSGLGMSIVKNLVEFMHGTVTVASEKDKGTTFTIQLDSQVAAAPSASETEAADTKKSSSAGTPATVKSKCLQGMQLLLAEDNAMNMEIAKAILKAAGAEVTGAFNGQEALNLFLNSAPGTFDAILMDIIMPELNGYETTRQIRSSAHPDGTTIPIIAMSANAFASDVQQSLAAGMNDHVPKPIDVKLLLKTLQRYYHKPGEES
jgi:signal transduction histidine kinase